MVKIGDKVRFLNAVGGGIVRKFINKELVSVEEEDGFETPVLIKECVVIADAGEVTAQRQNATGGAQVHFEPEKPVHVRETKGGDELNVVLAYLPEDDRSLQNTNFDCYLVNDSNYWLFFTYMSKEGANWKTRFAGMAEPNMKLHLEEFGKEQLNELERVCVQLTAFKRNKDFELKNPVSVELRLDTVKFYKLHSFRPNDYFDDAALIYPIVKGDVAQRPVQVSASALEQALQDKKAEEKATPRPISKLHRVKNGIVEVDLHIDELLDNTAGMSNADMLVYQLDTFRQTLEQFKAMKGQRIVFIHGKGDGVLRNALLKELNSKYKKYGVQDASFREYGFGATMVTIR